MICYKCRRPFPTKNVELKIQTGTGLGDVVEARTRCPHCGAEYFQFLSPEDWCYWRTHPVDVEGPER